MDRVDGRLRVALCFLTILGGGLLARGLGVDVVGWFIGAMTMMIAIRFIV